MNVYLCGFMGCGKSTIGKILAKKLDFKFIDLDSYIEQKSQMKIPEIFSLFGEKHFRKTEAECLTELSDNSTVIATGGGALVSTTNAMVAKQFGRIIFIDTSFACCFERIQKSKNRPLVATNTKSQLFDLFKNRIPYYITHADFQVDGDNSPEDIADKIIEYLKS